MVTLWDSMAKQSKGLTARTVVSWFMGLGIQTYSKIQIEWIFAIGKDKLIQSLFAIKAFHSLSTCDKGKHSILVGFD